ncbi:hypothetical protein F2P81_011532 [Scophthalmus maximus]|uniref:Uncharacterized protein n=1 Tax=Scophthalmus maximus TaxID=52904 RepID=A0A6A4SWH0_SCOMX|nr:hypothetical protein F2P81_011532 [Scophthalmus maximus]
MILLCEFCVLLLLRSLEALDLSYNQFASVPMNLPRPLQKLNLQNNSIRHINAFTFRHLRPGLQSLRLSHNALSNEGLERASFVGTYRSLGELLLDNNHLGEVPRYVRQFKNLQVLRLDNNQISAFVRQNMDACRKLMFVWLDSKHQKHVLMTHMSYHSTISEEKQCMLVRSHIAVTSIRPTRSKWILPQFLGRSVLLEKHKVDNLIIQKGEKTLQPLFWEFGINFLFLSTRFFDTTCSIMSKEHLML